MTAGTSTQPLRTTDAPVPLVVHPSQIGLLEELLDRGQQALAMPVSRATNGASWHIGGRERWTSVWLHWSTLRISTGSADEHPAEPRLALQVNLDPIGGLSPEDATIDPALLADDEWALRAASAILRSWKKSLASTTVAGSDAEWRLRDDCRRNAAIATVALADAGIDSAAVRMWRNEVLGGCQARWLSPEGWRPMPPRIARWVAETFTGMRYVGYARPAMTADCILSQTTVEDAAAIADPVTRMRLAREIAALSGQSGDAASSLSGTR